MQVNDHCRTTPSLRTYWKAPICPPGTSTKKWKTVPVLKVLIVFLGYQHSQIWRWHRLELFSQNRQRIHSDLICHMVLVDICPTGKWKDVSFLHGQANTHNCQSSFHAACGILDPPLNFHFPVFSAPSVWVPTEFGSPVLSVKPKFYLVGAAGTEQGSGNFFVLSSLSYRKHSVNTFCFFSYAAWKCWFFWT